MAKTVSKKVAFNKQNLASLQLHVETRLATVVAAAPCVVCAFKLYPDKVLRFTYCSPAIEELFGLPPRDLERDGSPVFKSIHPEDQEHVLETLRDSAEALRPWQVEFRVCNPYKGEIWVEGHALPRQDLDGAALWHGYLVEITGRKKEELQSLQNEALCRAALESTAEGILVVSEAGHILTANRRFRELWRVPAGLLEKAKDELLLTHVLEQLTQPQHFLDKVHQLYGTDEESLDLIRFKDGRVYERFSRPLYSGQQRIGRLWSFRDITERERADEALRQSESLLRCISDASPDLIFVKDRESRIVFANPATLRVIGKPHEAILGRPMEEVFENPAERKMILESDRRVLEGGRPEFLEQFLNTPEGPRVLLCTKAPRLDADGKVVGLVGVARDITQRKRMEDALRQSEASLATAQRIAHVGSWEFAIASQNPLMLESLGWSDEVFRIFGYNVRQTAASAENFFRAAHPHDRARLESTLREIIERRQPGQVEHRSLRPDGSERVLQQRAELVCGPDGRPFKLVGTVQDITERRGADETRQRLESKLRQSQKMEAIGQLAGGVAHDFNNLLTVILGNTELLSQAPNPTAECQELTRQIAGAARRAASLIRQLLAFSRQQVMQVQRLDLNEVLADVYKMLYRILGEHIALQCNYAPELPAVEADPGMIEQVIMNLAINARDAMPKGGRLVITTQTEMVDRAAAARNLEAREGRFVVLSVTDTGCGMDQATVNRVFEPFFTTKDVGKGTGLGLATVYGIVKQHNGWLEVASQVGQGSTFRIFLPSVAPTQAKRADEPSTALTVPGGRETILLVEDEPAVRTLALACLRQLGYRVLEAANGPEALRLFREHHHNISLLLTDLIMPEGMNGHDLAQQLRMTQPNLKAIFSSGYSREIIGSDSGLQHGDFFLPKPYEFAALARLVRHCLDNN